MGERDLEAAGETREGSNFGKGQIVAANYTMSPEIQVSENTGGAKATIFGKLGSAGKLLDRVSGGLKKNEASTTLLLIDNRSSVQIATSQGNAAKFDFDAGLGVFARNIGGAADAYTRTPEGKSLQPHLQTYITVWFGRYATTKHKLLKVVLVKVESWKSANNF